MVPLVGAVFSLNTDLLCGRISQWLQAQALGSNAVTEILYSHFTIYQLCALSASVFSSENRVGSGLQYGVAKMNGINADTIFGTMPRKW